MEMKIEVVPIPVRDVDSAKHFDTKQAGFNLDHDVRPGENMRVVQMTPPGSACSVVIGEGLPLGEPGSAKGVQLVVEDLDAIRSELAGRGVSIARCGSWAPKVLRALAIASSTTRTATCGRFRSTSGGRRSQLGGGTRG
jgi:hypothetical protein